MATGSPPVAQRIAPGIHESVPTRPHRDHELQIAGNRSGRGECHSLEVQKHVSAARGGPDLLCRVGTGFQRFGPLGCRLPSGYWSISPPDEAAAIVRLAALRVSPRNRASSRAHVRFAICEGEPLSHPTFRTQSGQSRLAQIYTVVRVWGACADVEVRTAYRPPTDLLHAVANPQQRQDQAQGAERNCPSVVAVVNTLCDASATLAKLNS
ncbi:hypothetical protein JX266_000765 [Neoarthrinium moseri]|nr:hypothetical protein JX266_000765 [Neoarthrinium moseri]